jgi:ribosomal protein S18 acetylase RimI-like enzyme
MEIIIVATLIALLEHAPDASEDLTNLTEAVKLDSAKVTWSTLTEFFKAKGVMAIAVADYSIVGAADLILCRKRNGFTYRLEHVSVLPGFRGQGIARKLIESLLLFASAEGRHVDLTCEPSRKEANKLYESMGFKWRDTNSRRLSLVSAV